MSYSTATGIIKIPVLFDMSGDAVVFGEEVSGDFVTSHLDFLLDMTTEANDISLNAADISSAILIGDQDTGDNIFYSGGSSGNIAVDNLCNRIAKAITRGKLVHIPKAGDHSNSGIPMGGRANLTNNLGELGSSYAIKYLTSVSPIGDEQMLGQAMARVASIHLVGSPLAAGIFEDQNQIQTDLETASTQTFNDGNTAFYNALAVQLSKVLGGSKSSAPMNNGSGSGSGGGGSAPDLTSQVLYENFEDNAYTGDVTTATIVSGGYNSSNYALQGGGKNNYNRWRINTTTYQSVSFWYYRDSANSGSNMEVLFDNNRQTNGINSLFFKNAAGHSEEDKISFMSQNSAVSKLYVNGVDQSSAITTTWESSYTPITYADLTWHHFYIEFSSATNMPATFGQPDDGGSTYTTQYDQWGGGGKFDEVRLFNTALSTSQIADLAAGNNGSGGTPLPPDWTEVTSIGATKEWYSVTSSADGTKMAATVKNGYMWTSTDSGATWTENTTSPGGGTKVWYDVESSADGTKLVATVHGGNIYTSTDSGVTWTSRESSRAWRHVTSSTDGTKLAAVVMNGYIYTSTDSGVNWTQRASNKNWYSIAGSADGTKLAATVFGGKIWYSTDSGVTWTESASFSTTYSWKGIASSADGTKMVTGNSNNGKIWNSTDGGATWTENTTSSGVHWKDFASSADGTKLVAVVKDGNIWSSSDSGATWTEDTSVGATQTWFGIHSSPDGTKLAAAARNGNIWLQISSGGSSSSSGGSSSGYPLDASGVAVPALKSIYEQLMNVPGRSQIMQTRDISGTVDNSNVTLAGGFPFISGDKLVMYLRPKIVFAAQTKAEQSTTLVGFSQGVTLNTPVFNVGRSGQGITGQTYSQSSVYTGQYGADKAFEGTVSGGYGYLGSVNFDNTTGAYNKATPDNTSVDGANLAGEWLQVNVGKKVAVTSYKIYPQNWEKHSIGGRSPHIFKLVYSDDGTNFLTADSQTVGTDNLDTSEWATTNDNAAVYIPKTFTLTNTKVGQYWRLIITSLYGNGYSNGGTVAIQELELNGSDDYTGDGDSGGIDLSGIQTNIVATAENIEDAFPGNENSGIKPEINKWGWMGSTNSDSLTLETTDVTDPRTCDLHVWKITITL